MLVYVFDTCLRLLHPFMPYITEVLWQQLPHEGAYGDADGRGLPHADIFTYINTTTNDPKKQ